MLGAAALGAYTLATTVILTPFVRIAAPLQQVFLPAFSQLRDEPERMADLWIRATRMVAAISIPPLVGIALVAADFVHVVLGEKWSDAVPVIQILAVVGILQSLHTLNAEVFLALGQRRDVPRLHAALGCRDASPRSSSGVQGDIVTVAACYAVATVLVEPVQAYLTTRVLGIPLWRYVRSLSGVAQAIGADGDFRARRASKRSRRPAFPRSRVSCCWHCSERPSISVRHCGARPT